MSNTAKAINYNKVVINHASLNDAINDAHLREGWTVITKGKRVSVWSVIKSADAVAGLYSKELDVNSLLSLELKSGDIVSASEIGFLESDEPSSLINSDALDGWAAMTAPELHLDGEYFLDRKFVLERDKHIIGSGRTLSKFTAKTGFLDDAVIQGGDAAIVFNSTLRNLGIDCNETNAKGYYSKRINELSGLYGVFITNVKTIGFEIEHTGAPLEAQNFELHDVEVLLDGDSPITAIGGKIKMSGTDCRGIQGLTINRQGNVTNGGVGLMLDGVASGDFARLNLEGVVDGIIVGSEQATNGFTLTGVNGNANVTNLVKLSDNFDVNSFVISSVKSSGATNSLIDEAANVLLTDPAVGLYARGDGTANKNANIITTSKSISQRQSATENISATTFRGSNGDGSGSSVANISSVLLAGATARIVFELESSASTVNFSGKLEVNCTNNVRHSEEKRFGGVVQSSGTVAGVISSAQIGTSAGVVAISDPEQLTIATAKKFVVTVTNGTASDTRIECLATLAVQGGKLLSLNFD